MSESPRFAFMRVFRIPDNTNGGLYLWRLRIIETPWFGVMLHRIFKPDGDRHPHDHPFAFVALVLRGTYVEHEKRVGDSTATVRHVRWVNAKSSTTMHRITMVSRSPVWSLVLRGPRSGSWGFLVGTGAKNTGKYGFGWVPWKVYLGIDDAGGEA